MQLIDRAVYRSLVEDRMREVEKTVKESDWNKRGKQRRWNRLWQLFK